MSVRLKLALLGLLKLAAGIVTLGALLFISAGTFDFEGAWRMLIIMFVPMMVLGSVLLIKSPKLMEKRLSMKESEDEQKSVIAISTIVFAASFILCGLDHRFGVTGVPSWLIAVGCIVFLATYAGFGELLRENEFLSRTVEVQKDQTVISTGMYGIVRHPMYFIITFMFFSMPLIIGSFLGIIPLLAWPVIISKRIRNEEKVLEEGLEGYRTYKHKVKYRLIPYIW